MGGLLNYVAESFYKSISGFKKYMLWGLDTY